MAIMREEPAALETAVSALRKQAAAPVAPTPEPPKAPPPVVTEPVRVAAARPPQLQGMAAKTARQFGLTDRQVEERYGNPKAVYVIADDVDKD